MAHPDAGGDEELFVWVRNLQEHVAGDEPEDVRSRAERRQPPRHHAQRSSREADRVPFGPDAPPGFVEDFGRLTARACGMAAQLEEPYATLLRLLGDCKPLMNDPGMDRQQTSGATYKSLAHIGHLCDMDAAARRRWYEVAESVPLAQRHAGHLIVKLRKLR
jgi:hypothetical protein